ncbi:MAG: hypothetical protein QM486_03795 [Flavobacteriaceae bacterium]
MLNSFLRGYYTPSFYKLVVNTSFDLTDLNELEKQPQPFSTFFHEYLHFIQDISTSFGLMNALMILNQIKYSNDYILKGKTSFKVPIPFDKSPDFKIAEEMRIIYMGPVQMRNYKKIVSVSKKESSTLIPTHNKYLEKIVVSIQIDNTICEVDFGGLSIIESMAHIAQKHFYPETDHNDIPYKFAYLIAEFLYPEFVKNSLYIFALCDACLMTYHPGLTFYEVLTGLKKDQIIPETEEEIYELVYSNVLGNGESIIELYKNINDSAKKELTHYFTTNIHENEKKWIEAILKRIQKIRINSPTFLLDILKQEKANSTLFKKLILEIGSPLIENIFGDNHMFIPRGFENIEIKIDIFSSINEIFKLFDQGNKSCQLVNFCKSSIIGDITDSRCTESPWLRCNDKNLCGYAVLWKMWELSDYKPILN